MSVRPITYPARPVNGGPLHKAQPKYGEWRCGPKYNGWRCWVHTRTGTMFNRKNELLSINGEFEIALEKLRDLPFEWADCEALERRHRIGRGSLVILDALSSGTTYIDRHLCQSAACARHQIPVHAQLNEPIPDNSVVLCPDYPWESATQLWALLQRFNREVFRCEFYEGVVAKRADSIYPTQLRSPEIEFPFWMKHRWAW